MPSTLKPYNRFEMIPKQDTGPRIELPGARLRLDREAIRRTTPGWIDSAKRDAATRFLLLDGQAVLVESNEAALPRFLSGAELSGTDVEPDEAIFLGVSGGAPFFSLDVANASVPAGVRDRLAAFGTFVSIRTLNSSVPRATWEMIAQASALSRWNRTSRFCPRCGASMVAGDAGYVRTCSNEDCPTIEFPRIDPAIIVRVMSEDRCLLARQAKFAPGLRSVIAGFVEPGETLEETVEREVREEVGLGVCEITYVASQPWPFPRALMLGFVAQTRDPRIRIDHKEIEAADWYTRERVRSELSAGRLLLPGARSISRRLINDWLSAAD